jgi:hypothetical protein
MSGLAMKLRLTTRRWLILNAVVAVIFSYAQLKRTFPGHALVIDIRGLTIEGDLFDEPILGKWLPGGSFGVAIGKRCLSVGVARSGCWISGARR